MMKFVNNSKRYLLILKKIFSQDYDRENPATALQAKRKRIEGALKDQQENKKRVIFNLKYFFCIERNYRI